MHLADILIPEGPLAPDPERDGEAVASGGGLVDGELHGEVPGGAAVSAPVNGSPLLLARPLVAGERNDGVRLRLAD